jgi:hypothetical protein
MTTQQAFVGRNHEGLKPADKSSATANHVSVDRPVLCPRLTRGTCASVERWLGWGVIANNLVIIATCLVRRQHRNLVHA